MLGIAITTAALVIVLSVFNGLEDLLRSLYTSFDPEIKIESVKGKSFHLTDSLISKVKSTPGVAIVTEVIEDYAYVRYRDADIVVTIKGVSDNFIDQHRLDNHLDEGKLALHDKGINYAIIGRGIKYALSIAPKDDFDMLQVFYIKNLKSSSSMDPSKIYSQRNILPGAVFSIEKNFDENYIFLPLEFVKDLAGYGDKRTALEVMTSKGLSTLKVQEELKRKLGDSFYVLTNEEQHKDLYRLLNIEKLFGFLALSLLIMIGSINIFFSLMMLAIDKKKDISILSALGGSQAFILRIFMSEGALISFIGAFAGLLAGGVLVWIQDHFGLVGMGMENAVVSDYPVRLKVMDFVYTGVVIVVLTFSVSIYPALRASRFGTSEPL
jgi:lipoprotein-releasing system permease protein